MTLTSALGTEHLLTYAVSMSALNPGQVLPGADLPLPSTAHLVQGAPGLQPGERTQSYFQVSQGVLGEACEREDVPGWVGQKPVEKTVGLETSLESGLET